MGSAAQLSSFQDLTNELLAERILQGDTALFEIIMRRHNQLLYRIARTVLRNDAEAEDVMQDAYVRAYKNLAQFAGRSSFTTWLSKIAFYEALARVRKQKRFVELETIPESEREAMQSFQNSVPGPEHQASNLEVKRLLEEEVDALPDNYRAVFVLRNVEEMSAADVAEILNITTENVKTRLHRAHALLRKRLFLRTGAQSHEAFLFHASRCDRVVKTVLATLESDQTNKVSN